ncbi:pyrroline-5-carboxylate reductase [Paraburkholderia sp. BL8N3]|nr:pyrroline-5-carboxylate reductase [Paraburkholderia sp. BL8N3]TCK33604.1 pyrroline-5-carboxylate reductase [Paraburkholderia sp. BL8N3]
MRIGFIGTGSITQAVVSGMVRFGAPFERIALSPRNARIAGDLSKLDARIEVCDSNQAVLDSSEVICLAVVPQIASDVLSGLAFEARHHVISFIATLSIEDIRRLVRSSAKVVRAIPLPAVSEGKGSTTICPADERASSVFSTLGQAIEVNDEHQLNALSAMTSTMASFYAVLEEQASWLVRQGLEYQAARSFLSGYYVGLTHDMTKDGRPFSELIERSQTPGGINEQLHAELSARGTYSHYAQALDKIMQRVQGRA